MNAETTPPLLRAELSEKLDFWIMKKLTSPNKNPPLLAIFDIIRESKMIIEDKNSDFACMHPPSPSKIALLLLKILLPTFISLNI